MAIVLASYKRFAQTSRSVWIWHIDTVLDLAHVDTQAGQNVAFLVPDRRWYVWTGSAWIVANDFFGMAAPGAVTVRTEEYIQQLDRWALAGAVRMTLEGTARVILYQLVNVAGRLTLAGRGGGT